MTADSHDQDLPTSYASCWEYLDQAAKLRAEFAGAWGRFLDQEPYEISLTTESDGTGTMSVWASWPADVVDELSGIIVNLAAVFQAALDEAVRVTVRLLTGQTAIEQAAALHFPIGVRHDEFRSCVGEGALAGLRPDQARLVQFPATHP